jgi:uncharacterized protein (DUF433 family)
MIRIESHKSGLGGADHKIISLRMRFKAPRKKINPWSFSTFANMKSWETFISIDSEIRFGKPCIAGTRISVADILGFLASGMTYEDIMADFPQLNKEQILAALAFAADKESITRIIAA